LVHLVLSDQLTASSNNGKILGHKRFEKRPQKIRICNKSNYVKMSNESNVGPNMNVHANDNDNATTATTQASACDLHDAILANSQSVVELYLEQQGADPNRSPQLPPVGVISSAENERARDLHRTLGRVFRRRQGGSIHPLHVAVCNAYHHCVFGRDQALGIIRSLLRAGANTKALSNGIVYCKIGTHASITIASAKTADKVALFLKRFPLPGYERVL
jgi:hypothetical protein